MKIFNYSVIAAVAVAIIAAFFVMGSPQTERLRKFDDQRVSHLQSIQWQILNHWQRKSELPQNLAELQDDISGFRVPVDPSTSAQYEYQATGTNTFRLCAEFNLESRTNPREIQPMAMGIEDNWPHGPGKVCFDRSIDPQLYPPYSTAEPTIKEDPKAASQPAPPRTGPTQIWDQ